MHLGGTNKCRNNEPFRLDAWDKRGRWNTTMDKIPPPRDSEALFVPLRRQGNIRKKSSGIPGLNREESITADSLMQHGASNVRS